MKRNLKTLLAVIFLTACLCFAAGCIDNGHDHDHDHDHAANETKTGEKMTVVDSLGRTVEVPKNPSKIAISGSGSGRYFGYLKQMHKIIAVDYQESSQLGYRKETRPYMIANPYVKDKPILGTSKGAVDSERLLAASPELVFMAGYSPDVAKTADMVQEKTGIPIVVFYSGDYVRNSDKVDDSLRMIGKILDCEERAEEVIKYFNDTKNDLMRRTKDIPDSEKPTVYVGGVSYSGAHGLDGTDPTYLPFTVLHAKNVAAEMKDNVTASTGYAKVSKEKIMEWNPDIIIVDLGTKNAAGGGAIVELKTDPSYKNLKAAKTGEIYSVNPHTSMGTNHETSLANAYYIGKVLYPEQFKDIDPEKKADEIYEFTVGKAVYNTLKENMGGESYQKIKL
ncbi:MAG: iron ABC transporter substrate-binding protein [Methanosarcinaceae archaeon]|nr:iron ABC transporter substrate-binding protein [Methanosarcinaceae archaeon]